HLAISVVTDASGVAEHPGAAIKGSVRLGDEPAGKVVTIIGAFVDVTAVRFGARPGYRNGPSRGVIIIIATEARGIDGLRQPAAGSVGVGGDPVRLIRIDVAMLNGAHDVAQPI